MYGTKIAELRPRNNSHLDCVRNLFRYGSISYLFLDTFPLVIISRIFDVEKKLLFAASGIGWASYHRFGKLL